MRIIRLAALLAMACSGAAAAGPNGVIVQSAFHGQIFGFDVDQAGGEGVLAEHVGGLSAVETFDLATGRIIKVVKKIVSKDDFLALGVVGSSIGLIEREHVGSLYVKRRIYQEIAPLSANKFTVGWEPPLKADDIIEGVSRLQGVPTSVFLTYHNKADGQTFVFGADAGAGTFGRKIVLTNPVFGICCGPQVAYDSATNRAVVASSGGAVGGPPPVFALADLGTGKVVEFNGLPGPPPYRAGFINGLAVDPEDGIAVTTTELDFSVEFYDLKKQTGFAVVLPGATGQLQSGSDVEYDPVNKLFFVAQSVSSTAQSGSSIHVYDTRGRLVESLNGFSFSNAGNVIGTHVALHPADRTGFVDGPTGNVNELEGFSY